MPAAIGRTAAIVAGRVAMGKSPVVVVSAMAKVTDQLLRAAAAASEGDRAGALAISSRLRSRHRDTAAELVKDRGRCAAVQHTIDEKFDALDEVLRGLSAILRTDTAHLRFDRELRRAPVEPHCGRGLL